MHILSATTKFTLAVLLFSVMFALVTTPVQAGQVGTIFVCYACQNTGNSAIDAALANNTSVSSDGILFALINTSAFPITGGAFSVSGATPADFFTLPTIATGATFILMPGITTDGGLHPSGGLFANTGTAQDTSDGDGGVNDRSIFKFTGVDNGQAVTSTTFGSSTAIAGTFTPADPGLFLPFRAPVGGGSTSFVGDGTSGDGGCSNCYYGEVATLNTPTTTATPEPRSFEFMVAGLVAMGWISFRRRAGSR